MEKTKEGDAEHAEAILHTPPEVDAGCFREVLRGTGEFSDAESLEMNLREDLIIEREVIVVPLEGQRFEDATGERPISRVVLREMRPEEQVLEHRESAIGDVLPEGHAPPPCFPSENAGTDDDIERSVDDHRDHRKEEARVVLVIGMQHGDDVGLACDRRPITRFLIRSIPAIFGMHDGCNPEVPGNLCRIIGAAVVHEDDLIHEVVGDSSVCRNERLRRIVGGHHDNDLLSVEHGASIKWFR